MQGAACAFDLLETSDAEVTLADQRVGTLPSFLKPWEGDRLRTVTIDAREENEVRAAMDVQDGAVSALPYYFNFPMARLAVETGIHFADLGGNTEIVRQQETLHGEATARGLSIMPDCGLAPGMVNILAVDAMHRLDDTESVSLFVGGLPAEPEPPLNYQIVYSLEGALDYYTTLSWILRESRPQEIEALSELEEVSFGGHVGTLEAFHTAGGLSTMPWAYEGKVRRMEYKTLRYPGHATIMRAVRDLGLLGLDPVDVGGQAVVPRDLFIAVVDPFLRKPDGIDLVALQVVARGTRDGRETTVTYRILDRYDREHGISAMMRTTAFSLSITGQMQVQGAIAETGVHPAYVAMPASPYIRELDRRGIALEVEET